MRRHGSPHQTKITWSIQSFHEFLTGCKKLTIIKLVTEILLICSLSALWACPAMSNQTHIKNVILWLPQIFNYKSTVTRHFLEILHLKNPAIWLEESILGNNKNSKKKTQVKEFCQILGLSWKTSNITFHSRLCPGKSNDNLNPLFWSFLPPLAQIWLHEIFLRNMASPVFDNYSPLETCKELRKILKVVRLSDRQPDGQTDRETDSESRVVHSESSGIIKLSSPWSLPLWSLVTLLMKHSG